MPKGKIVLVDVRAFRAVPRAFRSFLACEILSGPDGAGYFEVRRLLVTAGADSVKVADSMIVWG